MFKAVFVVLAVALPFLSSGQRFLIGSDADLRVNFGQNATLGSEQISSSPALFSGFKKATSIEVQYNRRIWKKLSIGVCIGRSTFSNWENPNSFAYTATTASFYSFSPVVTFKTPISRNTARFNFFISALPGIYNLDVKTGYESDINGNLDFFATTPVESKSIRFGGSLACGVDWIFNTHFGVSLSGSYTGILVKSSIFPEGQATFASLKIGLFLRLTRDHKYRYSNL